ncbi:hypothetical protein SLEP1_g59742 [Rubroshorea leprosula]|uniref:Uncharacterized protein n=1 Tax=Rubroshorea leprosula TaxID=152421 RepID=A0AAV5MT95_9ROSI|nr:hypothetical protein SLEP1_g59742 [Rubroshorea leprosula]
MVPVMAVKLESEVETSSEFMLTITLSGLGFRRSSVVTCSESEQRIPCQLQQFWPCHEDSRFEGSKR